MLRALAVLVAAIAPAALAASAPLATERATIDAQLRQARSEAAAASAEEQRLEQAAAKARDEATRLHARQLAAMQGISAAEAAITASDAQLRLANAQLAAQRLQLARQQVPVSAMLGALVMASRRPPLLLLADSGSTDELVKLRVLLRSTAPVIRERTAALKAQLNRQSELERSATAARDDLHAKRQQLVQRRAAFAELEQQALALAKARGSEAIGVGDVALARQEQVATAEATASSTAQSMKIARELAELGPVPLKGSISAERVPFRYVLPADAPVIDGLGSVSTNGVRSRGVLLATRRGAPITAPASGTILFAGPFRDYDGVIIIDHRGGWKSVLVNAGTALARGATVGVGDHLGTALGPVEIQLQHDGKAVSPALIAGSSAVLSNGPKGG
jgi:septal ring factor EnvC (AmiA/AmiB activator)